MQNAFVLVSEMAHVATISWNKVELCYLRQLDWCHTACHNHMNQCAGERVKFSNARWTNTA